MVPRDIMEAEGAALLQLLGEKKQAAFARENEVPGGPSMLSQHIHARRPIGRESAIAYARGLRCEIAAFSPRLDAELRQSLPHLGSGPAGSSAAAEMPTTSRYGSGSSPHEPAKPAIGGPDYPVGLTETVTSRRRGVPVRGTVVTGENDVVDVSPLERDPIGWVSGLTSEGAYALRIKGDGLWPVIEAESFIVVEPALPPKNGQKVLITLRDGRRLIKKLQYATDETVSVSSIKTGAPQTFDALAIEVVHSIGSVVEAARWERA